MKFQSKILIFLSACSIFSHAFTPHPSFRIQPLRKLAVLNGSNFGDNGGGFGGGGFGGGGDLDGPPLPGQGGGGGFGGNNGFGSNSFDGPPLPGQGPPLPGQGGNSNGGGGFGSNNGFGGPGPSGPPLPGQGGNNPFGGPGNSGGFGGGGGFGSNNGFGGGMASSSGPPLPGQSNNNAFGGPGSMNSGGFGSGGGGMGSNNGFGGGIGSSSGPPLPGQSNNRFGGPGNSGGFGSGGGGMGSSNNGFGGGIGSSSGPPLPGQSNNRFGGPGNSGGFGSGGGGMGSSNSGFGNQNNRGGFQPQMQRSPQSQTQGGMQNQFRDRSGSLGMDRSPMGGGGMQLANRNNNNYNTMQRTRTNAIDRSNNQFMRNANADYYFDPRRDTREMMDNIEKIVVQGNARKTCTFDENVRRVGILMHTEGRPLNATVDLWQGPDNAPQQMQVYLEEGWKRPFRAIVETPGSSNSVSFKNRNQLEYPLLVGMDVDRTGDEFIPSVQSEYVIVQGGGVHSMEFEPEVEAVQVSFTSDGRPMNARLELLQGPSNTKQIMDMYCENGIERPFNIIIETPGAGNVVRAVNLAPLEFPLMVASEPFRFQDYPPMDDGVVTWNTLGRDMQAPVNLANQQSTQSAFGLNGGNDSLMGLPNSQRFGSSQGQGMMQPAGW